MIILDTFSGGSKVIDFFFSEEIINTNANSIIVKVSALAIVLGGVFFLLSMAWNYMVSSAKRVNDGEARSFVDKFELARCGLLLACIALYSPIAASIVDISEQVCKTVTPSVIMAENAQKVINEQKKQETMKAELGELVALRNLYNDPETVMDEATKKAWEERFKAGTGLEITCTNDDLEKYQKSIKTVDESSGILNNLKKIVTTIGVLASPRASFNVAALTAMETIRMIIYKFTIMYVRVLLCVGPLAFAFSIIPAYKDKIEVWFGTVLNGLFVFLTLNIIECIVMAGISNFGLLFSDPKAYYDELLTLSSNFAIIIVYLMAFKITAKYVGTGDAGAAVSKGVAVVVAAAAIAATIASAGVGGAAGGAVATAAKTTAAASKAGQNAFSGNES
jgi:hypothetical protein